MIIISSSVLTGMNEAKEGDVGDFFNVLIKAEGRIKHKVVTVNDQTGVLVE